MLAARTVFPPASNKEASTVAVAGGRTGVFDLDRELELRIPIRRIQVGLHLEVADVDLGRRPEIHVAEDAAHPPEVLVLEVRSVAPAEVLDGEQVLAGLEERGDVELDRRAAVLAHADLLAVDPEVEEGVDAVEGDQDPPARPVLGHREGAAVGVDRVVRIVGRHVRRLPRPGPRILRVHVDRDAVALDLDVGRHRDRVPLRVVEIRLPEVRHPLGVVLGVVVFPVAVERAVERRLHSLLVDRQLNRAGRCLSGQMTIVACGGRLLTPVSLGFSQSFRASFGSAPRPHAHQATDRMPLTHNPYTVLCTDPYVSLLTNPPNRDFHPENPRNLHALTTPPPAATPPDEAGQSGGSRCGSRSCTVCAWPKA